MFRQIRILVDIPALDRLLAFLEAGQQSEVDKSSALIAALTMRLQQHRLSLEGNIQSQQEKQ